MIVSGAIRAWRAALGPSHVVADEETLAAFSSATHVSAVRVPVVLRPGTREQVRDCVLIARAHGVALHPVSGGTNWGYGSRLPDTPDTVVVDLGRMKRIIEVDTELATATVEPGVSFRQLAQHLRDHAPDLVASVTSASGQGSVIGHALERGLGDGPLGDRARHLLDLEVVAGTGEVLDTGSGRFGTRSALRAPAGVDLSGLFTQTGMGIVTRATVLLARRPAQVAAMRIDIETRAGWAAAVDTVRSLMLDGAVRAPVTWWNDVRRMANVARYPWAATGGVTPLPSAVRAAAREQLGVGAWSATICCEAPTREHLDADVRLLEAAFARPGVRARLTHEEGHLEDTSLLGWPDERNLRAAYWRRRSPVPPDPDPGRDRCGVLWLDCAFPHLGTSAARADEVIEQIAENHGFEPIVVAMSPAPRTLLVVPMVSFDLAEPGEGERAAECMLALQDGLVDAGGTVTRANPVVMGRLPRSQDSFDAVAQRVREVFDPDAILAPGRYPPGGATPRRAEADVRSGPVK